MAVKRDDSTQEYSEACNVSGVYDGLWLGSQRAAADLDWLRNCGIEYILNITAKGQVRNFWEHLMTSESGTDVQSDDLQGKARPEFRYMRVACEDLIDMNITKYWDRACEFLSDCFNRNSKVLVHCRAGRSRSVATVIAWGMKGRKMSLHDAYLAVSRVRPRQCMNIGFQMALMRFELVLNPNLRKEQGGTGNTFNFFPERAARLKKRTFYGDDTQDVPPSKQRRRQRTKARSSVIKANNAGDQSLDETDLTQESNLGHKPPQIIPCKY